MLEKWRHLVAALLNSALSEQKHKDHHDLGRLDFIGFVLQTLLMNMEKYVWSDGTSIYKLCQFFSKFLFIWLETAPLKSCVWTWAQNDPASNIMGYIPVYSFYSTF